MYTIDAYYRIEAENYPKKLYRGGLAQAILFGEWLQKIGYKNVLVQGKTPEEWRKEL